VALARLFHRTPLIADLVYESDDEGEEQAGAAHVDMDKYHKAVRAHMSNLFHDNPEAAEKHATDLIGRTTKHMHKTARRIHRITSQHPEWSGSKVTVSPNFNHDERRPWDSNLHEPVTHTHVQVHHPDAPKAGEHWDTPGFTYSPWERMRHTRETRRREQRPGFKSHRTDRGAGQVDDVHDAGDTDFFPKKHPETESDYFHLVNALRKGKPQDEKKARPITLYTARPATDRHLYKDATHLPRNLFLSTNMSDAHGIGHDFGGRDVWQVRMHPRHLVKTLDGPTSHYQIVGGKGKVPVHSISPMSLHGESVGLSRVGLLLTEMDDNRWHRPDVDEEHDEIVQQARSLKLDPDHLKSAVTHGKLGPLSRRHWSKLDNSDSWHTKSVESARARAETYGRDIDSVMDALHQGHPLPAPMVLHRKGERPYLIGGNTRLMAARALGVRPHVIHVHM
jgi:hypothetical protein